MEFFRKGLEEVITLPAPHIPDIDEVEEVKRIVALEQHPMSNQLWIMIEFLFMQYKKFVINMD